MQPWLTNLLEVEIFARIDNDPRTSSGTFLGWPKSRVYWDVVEGGQADFDAPIGQLTGADRVLLYARYNQRRHLDELGAAFQILFKSSEKAGTPTVIDLGCGPFTAGLALASQLGNQRPFNYFGIDRSVEMCALGERLASEAMRRGALHPSTSWSFGTDLEAHDFGGERWDLTLVVASYLLASETLVIDDLCAAILRALASLGSGATAFLYTNSAKPGPNAKWPALRDALCTAGFSVVIDAIMDFDGTRTPAPLRYALLLRPAQTVRHVPGVA